MMKQTIKAWIIQPNGAIMTDDLRLTVVSDPTKEFPHNQNNRFKVRLPRPLTLPKGSWAMSLWSLSVPDEALDQPLGQDMDYLYMFGGIKARLWNIRHGKYRSHTANTWIYRTLRLQEAFQTKPKTGVDLWKRVHQIIQEQRTQGLQADKKTSRWHVQQPDVWYPTFRWEGEDWIMEANRSVSYNPSSQKSQFLIPLKIAQAFGFMTYDPVAKEWKIGPNLVPSYPTYEYQADDVSSSLAQTYPLRGPTQRALLTYDVDKDFPKVDWFRTPAYYDYLRDDLQVPTVDLSSALEWRFIHLNRSYERFSNRMDTVMIYTNAVQSTVVNQGQFPLLRSLQVNRRGQGRVTVEPYHREWIPLNGTTLETLEFQLATPSGPLTDLSPGQTILTIGLKPIKRDT